MTVKTELSALSALNELEEVSSYLNKENLNDNFIQEISEFKTKLEKQYSSTYNSYFYTTISV